MQLKALNMPQGGLTRATLIRNIAQPVAGVGGRGSEWALLINDLEIPYATLISSKHIFASCNSFQFRFEKRIDLRDKKTIKYVDVAWHINLSRRLFNLR